MAGEFARNAAGEVFAAQIRALTGNPDGPPQCDDQAFDRYPAASVDYDLAIRCSRRHAGHGSLPAQSGDFDYLAGLTANLDRYFAGISEEERRPIVRNNAMKFFGLSG